MPVTLYWKRDGLNRELVEALETLAEEYPLLEGEGSPQLHLTSGARAGSVEVRRADDAVTVRYGTLADALRGIGCALAGAVPEAGGIVEASPFTMLGIMLDCSRNAVMTVAHLRRWLRRLALLGYNMVMLYTEDTYKIDGEPFFGLLRGAYSREELAEIDAYAARLGIEMIGCIQTLGHLEQILKWPAYAAVRDTERELLVGEPKTYDLIRKMISTYAHCFRSRRIHVGMDETHTLGRGRYLDRHGHRSGFEILNEHLARVIEICEDAGLRPMMWSDMFFRLASGRGMDFDPDSAIPEQVKQAIPQGVELVYWDYYHDDEDFYLKMLERHRQLGREPIMASGVWTWLRLWHGRGDTERNAGACIRACEKAGVKEIFFTLWGDDGGYCEYDSSLAGLAFAAAQCYGEDERRLRERYAAVCGADYEETCLGSKIEDHSLGGRVGREAYMPACMILWDDPLLGIHWLSMKARHGGYWEKAREHFQEVVQSLEPHRYTEEPVDLAHASALARFLLAKIDCRQRLEAAYESQDMVGLEALAADIPGIMDLADELAASFRRQWLRRNKPFGLEVMQTRLAGQRARYAELERALRAVVSGESERIAELDEGLSIPKGALSGLWIWGVYSRLATSSSIL